MRCNRALAKILTCFSRNQSALGNPESNFRAICRTSPAVGLVSCYRVLRIRGSDTTRQPGLIIRSIESRMLRSRFKLERHVSFWNEKAETIWHNETRRKAKNSARTVVVSQKFAVLSLIQRKPDLRMDLCAAIQDAKAQTLSY